MIAAQQLPDTYDEQENSVNFTPNNPDINETYRRARGYHYKRTNDDPIGSTTLGLPPEVHLEAIDKLRIPLEEKQMDGIELTSGESELLLLLEDMTDNIMSRIAPEPKEPQEITLALKQAERVLARSR